MFWFDELHMLTFQRLACAAGTAVPEAIPFLVTIY